jgi:hypothetical protein
LEFFSNQRFMGLDNPRIVDYSPFMTAELTSTSAVVTALGGFQAVAELTGRKYNAVWNWAQAQHFPPNTYLVMTKELRRLGKSAPATLWKMTEAVE